ncbi:MAG: PRTRC system protein E [Bifidobacteriaceae bacterium]|nr:PRTRC system protein E [Bifidobacteriaceae bacterium]
MGPQIFTVEFEQQLIITVLTLVLGGGGGIAIWLGKRRSKKQQAADTATVDADNAKDLSDAYRTLVESQVNLLVKPLKEQVAKDHEQIEHLEQQQKKLFAATRYGRELGHWLADTCGFFPPEWLKTHPKPHLPDILREDFGDLT